MTYNIHPLFVHFPIALLLLYSLIKIFPWSKYFPKISWKHIEVLLLITGVVGALIASSTGEIAKELTRPDRQLVEMHSLFASISIWLYSALLLGEVLSFFNPWIILKNKIQKINILIQFIQKILTNNLVSRILALLGLIAISTTGLLGGVMVYGISADPIAPIIMRLFGIKY